MSSFRFDPSRAAARVFSTAFPAGIGSVARVERYAHLMDEAVRIPLVNVRVGLDPIVRIVPFVGNALGAALSLYPVYEGARMGVPWRIRARMLFNVGLDALIGSVPFAGLLGDIFWRANKRNCALLLAHAKVRERPAAAGPSGDVTAGRGGWSR